MRLKKLLTMALAGTLLIGGVVTAHAAELDPAWYAEKNPDVVAELGNSPEALRQHYEMHGRKEGRMANNHDAEAKLRRLFNAEEYGTLYPDVKEFYGADEEAMFQHYISFGLLEARRPSEKVSQAAAVSLKKSVEKALTDAGIAAVPGSAEVAALIEGTVSDAAQSAEAAKALTQVASVVEDAVAKTYEEVTNPKPAPSGGGSGSSGGSDNAPSTPGTPEEPAKEVLEVMVYTNVTCADNKVSDLGTASSIVQLTGDASEGSTVYENNSSDVKIMISGQNKIGTNYWYAIAIPKSAYNEDGVKQWILLENGNWMPASDNVHAGVSHVPADCYVFGIGDDGNDTSVKVALGKVQPGEGSDAKTFEFKMEFTRPEITVYNQVTEGTDSNAGKVASYAGESRMEATGGDGTESNPYAYNQIEVLASSKVGSTYWVIVNPGLGDITSIVMSGVSDVEKNKYFVDDLENKDKVFGMGDDGNGGTVNVNVTVSGKDTWYSLTLKAKSGEDQ